MPNHVQTLRDLEGEFKKMDKMVEREELRAFGSDTERMFKELDVIRRKQIDLAGDHMALEIIGDIPQHSPQQDESEHQKNIDSFNKKEFALKNLMAKLDDLGKSLNHFRDSTLASTPKQEVTSLQFAQFDQSGPGPSRAL